MAASIASYNVTTYGAGDRVITKPTGLAVGDLMVCILGGGAGSQTPPSGFSQLQNQFAQSSWGNNRLVVWTKIADSGDVAASNFTITFNADGIGAMLRVIDFNSSTPIPTSSIVALDFQSTTTPSFGSSVTPTTAESLILFVLCGQKHSAGTYTASTYAIATDDPTWTESFDVSGGTDGNGNEHQLSLASAPRTATSATGNSSATYSATISSTLCCMIVINPVAASGPTNLKSLDTNVKANIKSYNTNVIANVKSINTNA